MFISCTNWLDSQHILLLVQFRFPKWRPGSARDHGKGPDINKAMCSCEHLVLVIYFLCELNLLDLHVFPFFSHKPTVYHSVLGTVHSYFWLLKYVWTDNILLGPQKGGVWIFIHNKFKAP